VITTLEAEHLDCYSGLDDIKDAFVEFANHVPFYGSVILCLDEETVQDIVPRIERNTVTYGFSPQAEVRAEDISFEGMSARISVLFRGKKLGSLSLPVPGVHNIKNALAATAVGLELGIRFGTIKKALESFAGVKRRFEIKGTRRGVLMVDDYAHHPTEIEATLSAARKGWEHRRIVAVFQPHLYSRTRDFCELFGRAFFKADLLVVSEIYPAREEPLKGVSGNLVAQKAREYGHQDVRFIARPASILSFLKRTVRKNDLVITLGAGDIWKVGEKFLKLR
jgi:UDP-N-acetylmuramate--alanine ligase